MLAPSIRLERTWRPSVGLSAKRSKRGPASRRIAGPGTDREFRGVRVLVVEDESLVAMDLVGMLEELGAEVCGTAARGDEGLRKAQALRPQLAIVDVRLKDGETGIDLARTIADDLGVAIIFATAHTENQLAAAVPGAVRLPKPYVSDELAEAMRRVLRRQ